jgi:hypothetical protein
MFFWEDMPIFAECFCKIRWKDHEKEKITRIQKNFFGRFDLLKDYGRTVKFLKFLLCRNYYKLPDSPGAPPRRWGAPVAIVL